MGSIFASLAGISYSFAFLSISYKEDHVCFTTVTVSPFVLTNKLIVNGLLTIIISDYEYICISANHFFHFSYPPPYKI